MAELIVDKKARPVPQILNADEQSYIPWKGYSGAGYVYVPDGFNETLGSKSDDNSKDSIMGKLTKATEDLVSVKEQLAMVKATVTNMDTNIAALKKETLIRPNYSRPIMFHHEERTASSYKTGDMEIGGWNHIILFIDVSAMTNGSKLTLLLETKDPENDKWFSVINPVEIDTVGTKLVSVRDGFGYKIRLKAKITGDTNKSVTFSVGGIFKM